MSERAFIEVDWSSKRTETQVCARCKSLIGPVVVFDGIPAPEDKCEPCRRDERLLTDIRAMLTEMLKRGDGEVPFL